MSTHDTEEETQYWEELVEASGFLGPIVGDGQGLVRLSDNILLPRYETRQALVAAILAGGPTVSKDELEALFVAAQLITTKEPK